MVDWIDLICCSPYLRCRQTVDLVRQGQPRVVDTRLAEFQAGKQHKVTLHQTTRPYGPLPGANEPWGDCAERLDRFLDWLQTQPARRVLVVAHGVAIRYFYQRLMPDECPWARGRDVPYGAGFTCDLV